MIVNGLDLIMYIVIMIISYILIRIIGGKELAPFSEGLGGIMGAFILFAITLIYIILFAVIDLNWIEILPMNTLKSFLDIKLTW